MYILFLKMGFNIPLVWILQKNSVGHFLIESMVDWRPLHNTHKQQHTSFVPIPTIKTIRSEKSDKIRYNQEKMIIRKRIIYFYFDISNLSVSLMIKFARWFNLFDSSWC